jgi:hypothetical protein
MRTHGLLRVASWQNEKLEWQCSCYATFDSPQRLVDHMCGVRHKHHVARYRAALKRASVAERRVKELEAELAAANAQLAKLQRQHRNDEKTLHMFSSAQIALAEQADQLAARADHAELELRRFYECSDIEAFPRDVKDGVCYDYGSVEVHAPTVWHRRPEE